MIDHIMLPLKKMFLNFLDSAVGGAAYIITAISINQLDWIYKIIMIPLGITLLIRGWHNAKEAKIKKQIAEKELKIKQLQHEKVLEETEL
jgi:hypothetical protein